MGAPVRTSNTTVSQRSIAGRWAKPAATALLAATLVVSSAVTHAASAAGLIRDAETETLIRDYAKPIFNASGLGSQGIDIHIVNDRAFNAFVVDGHNMFIHAGTVMMADTPNQVIGVIAHESGHITGGHLARLRSQMAKAKSTALMLQLLGLAAMAAGAVAGEGGVGQAGAGIAFGGTEAMMRSVLAYRQDEESSADQAAVTFLNATQQSGKGMLESFEYLNSRLIGIEGINPFLQSHPLPAQRLAQLRGLVTSSPYYNKKDPQELQFRHDLVRAKLVGFMEKPEVVFNKYPKSDRSFPSYYARAIATYRDKGVDAAMPLLNALVQAQPNWPYFHELRGQFLFEAGRAAQAVPDLEKAVELAPDEPLIRVMLAQALLGDPTAKNVDAAIKHLQFALARERSSSTAYRQLAIAYGRKAERVPEQARRDFLARADLASAEAYFYEGQLDLAKMQAKRAKTAFIEGTPNWIQADDILAFQPPKTN
jgi:predicted Zn-dependent protease